MPAISVVMSTYNRENIVLETINSILNQTFKDFEFIIVNDASSDSTAEILKNIDDYRVIVYNNYQNKGISKNCNFLNKIANGKYIVRIDDDDISMPNRLEIQYEYMENHPEIALSGTFIETFGENARPSWVFYTESDGIEFIMPVYNPICHSSIIYRKDFMEQNGICYDENKQYAVDYDFYKQIIQKGGKISNIPEILLRYRMHPKRVTDEKLSQQIQINVAEQVKDELLSEYFNENEKAKFKEYISGFPFNNYNKGKIVLAIEMLIKSMAKKDEKYIKAASKIKTDILNNRFVF